MQLLAFNIFFYTFTFSIALICWIAALLDAQATTRAILGWWGRRVCGAVTTILGARVEVLGADRLPPGGPQLIVSKHQSELDAILFFALFPDMGAVVMQELERYPFVGRIIASLDMISVSVDNGPQGRTAAVVSGATRLLAQGRPVLIYPEGTLMSLGARERYRTGAWRIYAASGATVTPVALSLGAIWPRREWRKRTGRTGALEFLDPIGPGLDEADFMTTLESRIEAATMALIRRHAAGADLAAAEARFERGAANQE